MAARWNASVDRPRRFALRIRWLAEILFVVALISVSGPALGDAGAFEPDIGFGLGVVGATVSSPLRTFDDGGGVGLQILLEKYYGRRFVWDLRLGGFWTDLQAPEEIYYPDDDGDWSVGSTALRWVFGEPGEVNWWAGPEGSLHYAQMQHFDYVGSGLGVGPALGMDLPLDRGRWILRLGAHLAWVDLETDSASDRGWTFVGLFGADVLFRTARNDGGDRAARSGTPPRSGRSRGLAIRTGSRR